MTLPWKLRGPLLGNYIKPDFQQQWEDRQFCKYISYSFRCFDLFLNWDLSLSFIWLIWKRRWPNPSISFSSITVFETTASKAEFPQAAKHKIPADLLHKSPRTPNTKFVWGQRQPFKHWLICLQNPLSNPRKPCRSSFNQDTWDFLNSFRRNVAPSKMYYIRIRDKEETDTSISYIAIYQPSLSH